MVNNLLCLTYKGLKGKYQKLVPCNCTKCAGTQEPHFFQYANLQRRRNDGEFKVQCDKSYIQVDVLKLLEDIEIPEISKHADTKIHVHGDYYEGNDMSNKAKAGDGGNAIAGNGNTATAGTPQKSESVFTKPIFYIVLFVFIYACLLLLSVADLKEKGKIADATFTEIVLHPFSLLKSK